jgi:hypothetical protein
MFLLLLLLMVLHLPSAFQFPARRLLPDMAPVGTDTESAYNTTKMSTLIERSHGATGRLESLTQQTVHTVRASPMVPQGEAQQWRHSSANYSNRPVARYANHRRCPAEAL